MITNAVRRSKETLAKRLSPKAKSRLRSILYSLNVISLRGAENLIFESIKLDGSKSFIQIGVNDGQYADPMNLAIRRFGLKGALVEPQPAFLNAARKTYEGTEDLEFINCAISDTEGAFSFFVVDMSDGNLPTWVQGVGSLSRDKLLKLDYRIPDIEQHIREIRVACINVNTLLKSTKITSPDLLIVDAEGYDAVILKQFDLEVVRPNLILFEAESMSQSDLVDCLGRMKSNGYIVKSIGQDSVALKADSNLGRKFS